MDSKNMVRAPSSDASDTARPAADDAMDGRFYVEGRTVRKAPLERKTPGGSTISMGFPVATLSEWAQDAAAQAIADALNAIPVALVALRAAKTLCDNINEFGQVTDAEILDSADATIRAAIAKAEGRS